MNQELISLVPKNASLFWTKDIIGVWKQVSKEKRHKMKIRYRKPNLLLNLVNSPCFEKKSERNNKKQAIKVTWKNQ